MGRARYLPLVLIGVLVALWVLMLWQAQDPALGPERGALQTDGAEPVRVPMVLEGAADVPLRTGQRIEVGAWEQTGGGNAAAEEPQLVLTVVDKQTERPVAEADVWVLATSADEAVPSNLELLREQEADMHGWVENHGRRFRTDQDGRVRVPAAAPWSQAVARAGDRIGVTWFGTTHPQRPDHGLILLEPERILHLRVEHESRPVAGIGLEICYRAMSNQPAFSASHWAGTTGPDGRLALRLPSVLEFLPDPITGISMVGIRLYAGGGARVPITTIDLQPWPLQEVVVPAPATGAVELRVVGADPRRHQVVLREIPRLPDRLARVEAPGVDGRIRFEHVLLGRRYEASLLGRESVRCELSGPDAPGQRVRADLVAAEPERALRVRLVDGHQRSIRSAPVSWSIAQAGDATHDGAASNDEGYVSIVLPDRSRLQEVLALAIRVGEHEGAPALHGELVVRRVVDPGILDLGDVVVTAPPVLATGRVSGVPEVLLSRARWRVEQQVSRAGTPGWKIVRQATVARPGGPAFRIHGVAESDSLRLTCEGTKLTPLDGQPLPHESSAGTNMPARSRLAEGGIVTQPSQRSRGGAAALRWSGLAPGRYRVELFAGEGAKPLVQPTETLVVPGESTRPQEVDLRGRMRRVRIQVRRPDGTPLPESQRAMVLRVASDKNRTWSGVVAAGGEVHLLLAEPTDLAVCAPGFRRMELSGVFSDRLVHLHPGPAVMLRVDVSQLRQQAAAGLSVMLFPRTANGPGYRAGGSSGPAAALVGVLPPGAQPIPANGVVEWRVGEPGEYAIWVIDRERRFRIGPERLFSPVLEITTAPAQEFRVEVR